MVNVGLVGYGFMGKMHAQCYEATGRAKMVALLDVDEEKRKEAESKYGCSTHIDFNDMIASADIDLVDICTPTFLHEEYVVKAARAGKHIMCEKPMALTVDSCDRMIEAASEAGVMFMIGHVIRFWPEYAALKEIVDSGKYGKVLWVTCRRFSPTATWSWENWLLDPARSGGAILDLHIHDLDYISYLIGPPKRMIARSTPGSGGGMDSVFTTGWEHESGARSFAEASLALAPDYPFTMSLVVACEKATIKYDVNDDPSLVVYPSVGGKVVPKMPKPRVEASSEKSGNISSLGGYFNEIDYLVECVENNRKPEVVTPEDARRAVGICLAARESAATGAVVDL